MKRLLLVTTLIILEETTAFVHKEIRGEHEKSASKILVKNVDRL